ncbi:MAG: phage tail family protein, partial [Bacillus sp. (in: firmicutes)]
SHDPPFQISSLEGTGNVEAEIQTAKAPYQDGTTAVGVILQPRVISLGFRIKTDQIETLYELRQRAASVLNPVYGEGELRYEYPGGVKVIEAIPEHVPTYPAGSSNRGPTFQKAVISFYCPDPYWKDVKSISEPLYAVQGAFTFPLELPTEMGIQGSTYVIDNKGAFPAPLQIEFSGPSTNPRVTNETTGEYIQVNQTLEANQRLIINTAMGKKVVEIVNQDGTRRNAFNWLDLNSTFFQLNLGENKLTYSAEDGKQDAVVTITYQNRYSGI